MDLHEALRWQAEACGANGSPMYADVLARAADDVVAGGPVAEVLAPYVGDDPVADMLALRLMGSVHRLVLQRRAPELAAYYPSVGGEWRTQAGWEAFRQLVAEQPAAVAEWLDRPPQTNEVGRAAGLYGGLLHLPRDLPVRLLEIGASAGLNLRADRFCYVDDQGRAFGDPASPLRIATAWQGRALEPWPDLRVAHREGCDLRPVDPTAPEGRLVLTSYVWADMTTRLERLREAIVVAARAPARVVAIRAAEWLARVELVEGTTTVVMHSVMWQYLPESEKAALSARIAELGAAARADRRFAHLSFEPARRLPEPEFSVTLRTWPDGEERVIGTAAPHGVPTSWR